MPTYKTQGFIIRRKNFGETDRFLTIYTKNHGKIRVVAKGVRKTLSKLGGHLEPFYLVDLMLADGKNLDIITGAQIINSYKNIRCDKDLINRTYYISELIDLSTQLESENIEIFELIKESFQFLNCKPDVIPDRKSQRDTSDRESNNKSLVDSCRSLPHAPIRGRNDNNKPLRYFELKLISILGHYPELITCVVCKKGLEYKYHGFSYIRGGIVCENCNNQMAQKISPETIKFMRLVPQRKLDFINRIKIDEKILSELEKTNQEILDHIIEREIKSRRFL